MVMQAMRDGASNTIVKYIIFGLLLMATCGLVFSDIGGFFRGGVGKSDVAKVGGETISLASFDRGLRRSLQRIGIGPQEAYKLGYVDQFLAGEMRNRIMQEAGRKNDILIPRARIAGEVHKLIAPMAQGRDVDEVLKQVLLSQGMSEGELSDSIAREMSNGLLASSMANGFVTMSDDLAHDLYLGANEMRDVEYIVFPAGNAKDLPQPKDEDLQNLYEMTKESYAIPETRVLQIITVKDDNLKKTLEITDEELKQAYEDNHDSYYTPQLRLIEQVVVRDEATARKIHEAVKGGKAMQKAAADEGQVSAYLGERDFEDGKLQPEIKDAVIAAKAGALLDPVNTSIGWNVTRVEKIIPETTKSFDSVKKELKDEMYQTKLIDQRYALANEVDDLLASGTSPDELSKQVEVDIKDLPSMNSFGQDASKNDVLKSFEKTGSTILQTGFELGENETSPVSEMADGTFAAIHVKSIVQKTYKPFEDVKEIIKNNWVQDQAQASARVRIINYIGEVAQGKKTMKDVASETGNPLKTANGLTRDAKAAPKPLTPEAVSSIFAAPVDKPLFINSEQGFALAHVSKIRWPENVSANSEEFKKFKASIAQETQSEAMMVFLEDKTREYRAVVNNKLLQRAYAAPQDGTQQ